MHGVFVDFTLIVAFTFVVFTDFNVLNLITFLNDCFGTDSADPVILAEITVDGSDFYIRKVLAFLRERGDTVNRSKTIYLSGE